MDFEHLARTCRTPKQFRLLLRVVRTRIPYVGLFAAWGYPNQSALRYFINFGWPLDFVQWWLSIGIVWRSPIWAEWVATNKTFLWAEAYERLKPDWKPETVQRFVNAGTPFAIIGGSVSQPKDHFLAFIMKMANMQQARDALPKFEEICPRLVEAGQRIFWVNLLSPTETHLLEKRMLGQSLKVIASEESITVRTVQAHLQNIKAKLGTKDLVNAAVIAARQNMAALP